MVDTAGLWQRMGSPPIVDPQVNHPDRFAMMPRGTAPEIMPPHRPQLLEGDREHKEYRTSQPGSFVDQLPAARVEGHNSVYKTAGDAPIPPRTDNRGTYGASRGVRAVGAVAVAIGLFVSASLLST